LGGIGKKLSEKGKKKIEEGKFSLKTVRIIAMRTGHGCSEWRLALW